MTTSPIVPGVLPFAIDGHPFLIDPDYERTTVQVIRQQSDTSTEPGEQSLSPLGLWRRSQESWHHGAGQDFLDGRTEQAADPHRFRASKGIDPWARGQISLLHPTVKSWSSANTNLHLAVGLAPASSVFYLHLADGSEVYANALPYGSMNSLALQQGTGWDPTNATIGANAHYFDLTATSGAAVDATSPDGTDGMPVLEGRTYWAVVHTVYVSGGSARIPQLSVVWYDDAGATLSTSGPVVGGGTDTGSGHRISFPFTAPADAAYAAITVGWTTNWANGEIHSVVEANLFPESALAAATPVTAWVPMSINAGQAAQTVQSLATNGTYIWAALGTSGLHRAVAGATAATADAPAAPGSGQIHLVGFANGFLLAAGSTSSTSGKNTLWRVDSPLGPDPASLVVIKTHDNPNFEWTFIGAGRNCIYAGGNSGGNGEIYKITLDPNTGTLSTAASFATYLPDGETIHALQFYAGGIIMGTGKGVRLGQADGAGNIDYGPLLETDWPVRCLEPQGRWCWFGWTRYDTDHSLLGRLDLGYLTDTLTPAWASDLLPSETCQTDVVACVTLSPFGYLALQRPPVRVFTVAGEGVYIEDLGLRQGTGNLQTGTFRYATSEPKTPVAVDVRHHALPDGADISGSLIRDGDPLLATALGISDDAGSFGETFYGIPTPLADNDAEAFEITFLLTRPDPDGTDFTRSPELTRWTTKVLPLPSTIDETFTVRIHMKSEVLVGGGDGQKYFIDVPAEIEYLKGLERSRAIVEMQLADETHDVYVLSSRFVGQHWHSPKREFAEGLLELQMQTARG